MQNVAAWLDYINAWINDSEVFECANHLIYLKSLIIPDGLVFGEISAWIR